MSDLSLQLQQAASQLPVSSYFDEALFQREMQALFQSGPRYVGHTLSVPNPGDYYALPQESEGRALVRNAQGQVELISNVCRHRQAVMLNGRGSLQSQGKGHAGGNIVCPIHRWTYATSGELLGAPHFAHDPCLNLNNYKLREWNGLLFEDNGRDIAADLAGMKLREQLSFEGFVLDHIKAGKAMTIYHDLGLDKLDCTVAIIKNAKSEKMGKKDILKVECSVDKMDLDILGFIDHNITVNVIKDGEITEKKELHLPKQVVDVIKCKNPRCITSIEQGLKHVFILADPEKEVYRCKYCDEKYTGNRNK